MVTVMVAGGSSDDGGQGNSKGEQNCQRQCMMVETESEKGWRAEVKTVRRPEEPERRERAAPGLRKRTVTPVAELRVPTFEAKG